VQSPGYDAVLPEDSFPSLALSHDIQLESTEIRTLHPAVARPGRCAANIEFVPLSADESSAWLAARGVEDAPHEPSTLASLYARAEGRDPEAIDLADFGGAAEA
jgi:hypothetical protein